MILISNLNQEHKMTQRFCDKVLQIIIILMILFVFCTGIFESVYANKYKQYKDGCGILQTQILVFSVIDIVTGIVALIICASVIHVPIIENPLLVIFLVECVIGLWAVVRYHQIDNMCYDFWTTNAPELIIFNIIHCVLFWIICCISCIGGFRFCFKDNLADMTKYFTKKKYGSVDDNLYSSGV